MRRTIRRNQQIKRERKLKGNKKRVKRTRVKKSRVKGRKYSRRTNKTGNMNLKKRNKNRTRTQKRKRVVGGSPPLGREKGALLTIIASYKFRGVPESINEIKDVEQLTREDVDPDIIMHHRVLQEAIHEALADYNIAKVICARARGFGVGANLEDIRYEFKRQVKEERLNYKEVVARLKQGITDGKIGTTFDMEYLNEGRAASLVNFVYEEDFGEYVRNVLKTLK